MAVQNIECKLVQAQLNMIVAGEKFPADVLGGVDDHLKSCPDCRDVLFQKRAQLRRLLAVESTEPVLSSRGAPRVNLGGSAEIPSAFAPTHAAVMLPENPIEPTVVKRMNWKPIAYSAGLAAVLVAMSWIARDPTRVFGEKAAVSLTTEPASKAEESTAWVEKPAPSVAPPPKPSMKEPARVTPKVTRPPKRSATKALTPNRKPNPTPNGIRIYDANGKPIR